jgi:hypothetical protein
MTCVTNCSHHGEVYQTRFSLLDERYGYESHGEQPDEYADAAKKRGIPIGEDEKRERIFSQVSPFQALSKSSS